MPGKLNFRDLVTSLLADLAQLAARRFILGPIANALSGVFAGAGSIFANVLHAGGMVGSAGPSRLVPAMAFAAAPRMHGGGMAGLRHDEVPAILQGSTSTSVAFAIMERKLNLSPLPWFLSAGSGGELIARDYRRRPAS